MWSGDLETGMLVFALTPHPEFPPSAVSGIMCWITFASAGEWSVKFGVECPIGQISTPAPEVPQRADGLWRTTCFELFARDPRSGAYLEFNMSPSGCWAAYAFDSYREGMRELAVPEISITTVDTEQYRAATRARMLALGVPEEKVERMLKVSEAESQDRHTVRFVLSGALDAPTLEFASHCQVGISAVIEEVGGTKSYWALAHPPGKPDFHHPTCFAATLPPPSKT
jgi:hypothetical protein